MSEPIGNSEQLPVAWFYENDDIKWVTLYKDVMPLDAIPLYTHLPIKQSSLDEPVALRYDFDGHGYLYMDAGSGSDWASRVKDCEFLYTHPQKKLTDEEIMDCWENEVNKWQEIENYDIYNFARAIIKASRGEK